MNIIQPKYEIIEQQYNNLLEDLYKHIEKCGRTCYKSEDKITENSYLKFVNMLVNSNHGAMLEHGTVYLTIPIGTPMDDPQYMWKHDIVDFFSKNAYSKVKEKTINKTIDVEIKGYGMKTQASAQFYFITTNWRVIIENKELEIAKYFYNNYKIEKDTLKNSVLQWMTSPTKEHEKRYTVKFTCNIGVSREFNRHRKDSIGEESTRYCNYSKEKFGGELNVIKPTWVDQKDVDLFKNLGLDIFKYCYKIYNKEDQNEFTTIDYWLFSCLASEYSYLNLIRLGCTAQQAREVLNLSTKTELVHTAFVSDWCHFFNLRALGTTGAPHSSAKELAWPLMEDFMNKEYIKLDWIDKEKYAQILDKYTNIEDYIKL